MRRFTLLPLVATLCLPACRTSAPEAAQAREAPVTAGVVVHGALREMMHQGRTASVVDVAQAAGRRGSFAVGALADLAGEVTVVDGEAWLSYAEQDGTSRTVRTREPSAGAALLVVGQLPETPGMTLDEDIPLSALGDRIAALAQAQGVDTTQPITFTVEGPLQALAWHVIDGRKLRSGASHQEHASAGVQEQRAQATGVLVGFYSTRHQGIFTHHDSDTHVHVVLPEENASGHVDNVTVLRGARLRLPAPTAR
ncbi:acetolactate decarboxylase [Myxococcus qinghaiensis]|uniref:acetolactate decarboxylase n=1 Tax=Myxococcus qinghaiensis TaxID=2906758 RepID=UPI0020A7BC87|nr:acetolactate decarboxylase [Myxococcus qinghaiensis]MCP3164935.1 acetolactate decarboxylase [Myxococcus qinghaiensis]